MRKILVTGAGGPAAICFLRGIEGEDYDVYVGDMDPLAAGLYLVPENRRLILPAGDAPHFANAILDIVDAEGIDVVVPTVDSELLPLAKVSQEFSVRGCKLLSHSQAALESCLDKFRLYRKMRGVVNQAKTEVLTSSLRLSQWKFPAIAKPRRGSGSRGIVLVEGTRDIANLPMDGSYLLQELLPGAEYSVDVLVSQEGTHIAAVPRERMKVDSGVAVTARSLIDEELSGLAIKTAKALGLVGVANVQFRRDVNGELALLEVNPRFPGTMALTVLAGVNMPSLALGELVGSVSLRSRIPHRAITIVRTFQEHVVDSLCNVAPSEKIQPNETHSNTNETFDAEPLVALGA